MKSSLLFLLMFVILICTACGGGGGGNAGNVNVAGVWRGSTTLTQNTCNLAVSNTAMGFTHTVNQDGENIHLFTEFGVLLLGSIIDGNGFSVERGVETETLPDGVECALIEQIKYDGIDSDTGDQNPNSADVNIHYQGACVGNGNCLFAFSGVAVRDGSIFSPTPIPEMTTTISPVFGACSALVERIFSGDGACGLFTVHVDVLDTGLLMEPFGMNGATTFTTSAVNSALSTSVRNDLLINGAVGYSCAVECSPPLTFTVKCTKEGAASCTEKF